MQETQFWETMREKKNIQYFKARKSLCYEGSFRKWVWLIFYDSRENITRMFLLKLSDEGRDLQMLQLYQFNIKHFLSKYVYTLPNK